MLLLQWCSGCIWAATLAVHVQQCPSWPSLSVLLGPHGSASSLAQNTMKGCVACMQTIFFKEEVHLTPAATTVMQCFSILMISMISLLLHKISRYTGKPIFLRWSGSVLDVILLQTLKAQMKEHSL